MPRSDDTLGNPERRAEWDRYRQDHPPGTRVRGRVQHVAPFGVFVDLGVPFGALLLICYQGKPPPVEMEDQPKIGEEIEAYVLGYGHDTDTQHGQINLSMVYPVELKGASLHREGEA